MKTITQGKTPETPKKHWFSGLAASCQVCGFCGVLEDSDAAKVTVESSGRTKVAKIKCPTRGCKEWAITEPESNFTAVTFGEPARRVMPE